MRLAVPALIAGGVVQPEVGAEVDEGDAARDDLRRDRLALAMGQGGEDQADAVQRRGLEPLDPRAGIGKSEMRVDVRQRGPAWLSPNSRVASNAGWQAQSRSSSAPTKPEAPRMATSIMARHMQFHE